MNESRYAAIGVNPDSLTATKRAAIDSLTEAEFALLVRVQARLEDADGDVQGHDITFSGGGTFW
ncbi:MAG: aroma-sacti cluster domain-containing protein [Streptosporangiaceae bacterium]